MSEHSVAETKNKLSELIDRAEKGEDIVVTRHGTPVVRITPIVRTKPFQPARRPLTAKDLEWLDKHRVKPRKPINAAKLIRQMRDEGF
jgi:prevent-host-death family protein